MKKILLLFALLLSVCALFAEDERFSMIVGTVKTIRVPYVISSYKLTPSKTDTIQVEVSESTIRIVASSIGEVNLLVSGDGMSTNYTITVKSNLAEILQRLRRDLENLTELDIAINGDQIVIRGVVSNPDHWSHLMKVLPNYTGKCINYATFRPSSETLANLKKMLIDAGFTFCEPNEKPTVGKLFMKDSPDAVTITGELYTQQDMDRINQILASQTWLAVNGKADPARGQIQGIINLSVVETVLQVDIVYAGVQESESKKVGSNSDIFGAFSTQGLYDLVAGRGNGSAVINGGMDATVRFLAANGISRTYHAGHVSFANNDPQGGSLHTGGTVYVKVNGVENGSLQNIQYGLKIQVTGGLVSPTRTKLTLDLTNSALLGSTGDSYTLSEDTSKQTVFCDLGKTIVIAGSKKIAQDTSNSGLPVLRNTPVLKWFVSEDRKATTETRLLILASPRLLKDTGEEIELPPLTEDTVPVFEDAQKDTDVLKEEKKPDRGWLNWFDW